MIWLARYFWNENNVNFLKIERENMKQLIDRNLSYLFIITLMYLWKKLWGNIFAINSKISKNSRSENLLHRSRSQVLRKRVLWGNRLQHQTLFFYIFNHIKRRSLFYILTFGATTHLKIENIYYESKTKRRQTPFFSRVVCLMF